MRGFRDHTFYNISGAKQLYRSTSFNSDFTQTLKLYTFLKKSKKHENLPGWCFLCKWTVSFGRSKNIFLIYTLRTCSRIIYKSYLCLTIQPNHSWEYLDDYGLATLVNYPSNLTYTVFLSVYSSYQTDVFVGLLSVKLTTRFNT